MADVGSSIKDQAITRSKLHTTENYVANGELSLEHELELYKDVTLTAAQLDTLAATPVSLIAAPGSGKLLLVSKVIGFLDFNSAAYAGSSEVLSIRYTNGSGSLICAFSETTFLEASADAWEAPAMPVCNPVVNAAVVATANADFTTGDSPIYLRLYYRIVTSTLNNTP